MSFNYDHGKNNHKENFWTSYADLYTTLFTIFLFIYVGSTLRQGTKTVEQIQDKKLLTHQIEDLKQQIKVYEALKDDYLKKEATNEEAQMYDELMGKLDLLQEESKSEKENLRKQAMENELKEKALSKYQQLIRNIINSNVIAKTKIQQRNSIISEKDDVINLKTNEIKNLDASVANKKIELAETKSNLTKTQSDLTATHIALEKVTEAKGELENKLDSIQGQYQRSLAEAQSKFKNELNSAKTNFDEALNKERLTGAARAAREKEFHNEMAGKEKDFQGKLTALKQKYDETQGELKKAIDQINTRKKLTDQIRNKFAKNGIKAEVDEKTGEVVLDFKNSYFETGKADLKQEMIDTLQKFIPLYTEGLFEDDEMSNKIGSVEIVGFASPTYRGKYIDPSSLDSADRSGVNYNLDLSYNRAKSIFSYVFNTDKMKYRNQKRLMALVKVTSRSFLAQKSASKASRGEDFCKINDCKKEQKVIIKFNLKD